MDKNQAIRRSNMGFLLLLVALACTLLRLGRTGPYREKHLDLLRIDGTFKSENAETWDFGIPYGPMSQRRRHILTKQIDPGDFQHWNNRSGTAVVGFRGAHLAQCRVP